VPPHSRFDRLVKYLMSFTIGRSSAMLKLKPITCVNCYFFLDIEDVAAISELVDVFIACTAQTRQLRRDGTEQCCTRHSPRSGLPTHFLLVTRYQLDSVRSILGKRELEKLHQLFV
jgi:hypothetical protein